MKKTIAMLLGMLMLLALLLGALAESTGILTEDDLGIPNPWVDCGDDLALAAEVAGFEFRIPALANYTVSVLPGELIKVTYPKDEVTDIVLCEAAVEPESGDLSGDYNDYPVEETRTISGIEAAIRGDSELIYVANFNIGDSWYCISCTGGLSEEELGASIAELQSLH